MNYCCTDAWGWRLTAPIRSGLRVVVQPTGEQITLDEAKLNCRVDDDGGSPPSHPEDSEFLEWIIEAREYCENETGRALVPQTFELTTSSFPPRLSYGLGDEVSLPMGPIANVVSVTYFDGAGVSTVLATTAYTVDNWSEPGWLYPSAGTTWPSTLASPNAIVIRYTAGFTLPTDSPNDRPLPKLIRRAMMLYINDKYEHRGEQVDDTKLEDVKLGIDVLLRKYKLDIGIA